MYFSGPVRRPARTPSRHVLYRVTTSPHRPCPRRVFGASTTRPLPAHLPPSPAPGCRTRCRTALARTRRGVTASTASRCRSPAPARLAPSAIATASTVAFTPVWTYPAALLARAGRPRTRPHRRPVAGHLPQSLSYPFPYIHCCTVPRTAVATFAPPPNQSGLNVVTGRADVTIYPTPPHVDRDAVSD